MKACVTVKMILALAVWEFRARRTLLMALYSILSERRVSNT
jgi:hypothetical protein